ncbi:MAG: hypothetical protein HC808_05585 [Candidatus Competibacteraceae bacterium]|jgi:hypothetical protein|nr:hypothetical protein [Candidatus Competibacteraceae bacterium]NJN46028.1 hypothetical protein [Candidatus Competibacteraceae bacterium]
MTTEASGGRIQPGMVLAWSNIVKASDNFAAYVTLVGEGPFRDYEIQPVSAKSTVYGDERFRDGMRVPEKLLNDNAKLNEARQVGDSQRIKIHVDDSTGHHVSAEFPGHFFEPLSS